MEEEDKCSVPFVRVCEFLEVLSNLKGIHKRKKLIDFFGKSNVSNFFPIVRLMVPSYDMERGQYGLKERTLGKYYSELLSLPKKETEALTNFKDPKKQLPGCPAGGFVEVLAFVLKGRVGQTQNLSVEQVNNLLDELANALDKNSKKKVLAKLIRSMNDVEQKWLAKIILKDMKLGTHEKVLQSFHEKALEIFYNTNNLRAVFTKLKDKQDLTGLQLFTLGQPIRPMLAGRKPYQELKKILINQEVMIETKFDGERIQCHFMSDGNVKFFSRNAVDYTYLYGKSLRDLMLEHVHGVKACILDGELIVWDLQNNCAASFGQNKTVALEDTPGKCLCYVVFDILYIETGEGQTHDLMPRPLHERKVILENTVSEVPNRLQKVKYAQVKGSKAVFDIFNQAVQKNEEGIIIKRVDSPYIPDDRSTLWLKLKSDYFDGLSDSLDLLVVGGYYGSGFRTGGESEHDHITVFLTAAVSKIDLKDPKKSKFIPVTKVGTGYSIPELNELRRRLKDSWRPFRQSPDYWPIWKPGAGERPDYYIADPSKSVVLEVKAAEIVPSDKFPSGLTLRFPKVQKIRYDKNWDQVMTYSELQNIVESFRRGFTEVPRPAERQVEEPRKRKRKISEPKGQVMPSFAETDTSKVTAVSRIFNNCVFYIASHTGYDKQHLETLVVKNGGRRVQNYVSGTTHIIASDPSPIRVSNLIERYDLDIIHPEWLVESDKAQEVLELRPRFMVHASTYTQAKFQNEFTSYGDSIHIPYRSAKELFEITSNYPKDQLPGIVNYMGAEWWKSLPSPVSETIHSLRAYKLLGLVFYINNANPVLFEGKDCWREILELRIQAHGGEVAPFFCDRVTHILNLSGTSNFGTRVKVVDSKWLDNALHEI